MGGWGGGSDSEVPVERSVHFFFPLRSYDFARAAAAAAASRQNCDHRDGICFQRSERKIQSSSLEGREFFSVFKTVVCVCRSCIDLQY